MVSGVIDLNQGGSAHVAVGSVHPARNDNIEVQGEVVDINASDTDGADREALELMPLLSDGVTYKEGFHEAAGKVALGEEEEATTGSLENDML